jgi:hypothetical protein
VIDTTSQAAIEAGLRTFLLDTPAERGAVAGVTLRAIVSDRFWWGRASDVGASSSPYVAAVLSGVPPDPAYSDERISAQLTLQVIARSSTEALAVARAGDVLAQLLRGVLSESTGETGGLVWARSHHRSAVPRPESGPAASLVIEYHRTELVIWPAYLYRGH